MNAEIKLFGLVIALIASLGCHYGPKPDTPDPAEDPPRLCHELEVSLRLDVEEGCPRWRWIAVSAAGEASCPVPAAVGGEAWDVTQLFSPVAGRPVPAALGRYCVYEYLSGVVPPALVASLESLAAGRSPRLESLASDCAVIAPQATSPTLPGQLRQHFRAQAGRFSPGSPLLAGSGGAEVPRIELVFLDTQPTDATGLAGPEGHGHALAWIARDLVCAGAEGCGVGVRAELALPILRFDRNDPAMLETSDGGGHFGSESHVAVALWSALAKWSSSAQQRLVLNLSLGWHPRFGGLEEDAADMAPGMRSLYETLEVASCEGALVVAAAGNLVPGPDEDLGPLLPAGWSTRPAPGGERCAALLGRPAKGAAWPDGGEPLLYAAGGVRGNGYPLANARPEGIPPLVAYGDHAAVTWGSQEGSTAFLTVSSVSAAVVSTAAAAAWYYRPELSRRELMDLVWESGDDLGRPADFAFAGSGAYSSVRRVAVCPAVLRACPGCFDPHTECAAPPAPPALDRSSEKGLNAQPIMVELEEIPFCGDAPIFYAEAYGIPTHPCPGRQFYGTSARPWGAPQPTDNPCTSCKIQPPPPGPGLTQAAESLEGVLYSLQGTIDAGWEGELGNGTLENGSTRLSLDLGVLEAGSPVLVEAIPESFVLDGGEPRPILLRLKRLGKPEVVDVPVFVVP